MACPVCDGTGYLLRDACPLCTDVICPTVQMAIDFRRPTCPCFACDTAESVVQQASAELAKPQAAFWRHRWKIQKPGSTWTLSGHSRALVRTGFVIEELKVFLDAGVAWKNASPMPSLICVTHTHIDHCNALPMLLRTDGQPIVLAPRNHLSALREMADMTWSVKRADWTPRAMIAALPDRPAKGISLDEVGLVAGGGNRSQRWVPVEAGDSYTVERQGGWFLSIVKCFHTIEDVGYVLCESAFHRQGVDGEAEFEHQEIMKEIEALNSAGQKKEAKQAGRKIGDMMKAGRLCSFKTQHPRLAFLCDTTVQVFGRCAACLAGDVCPFAGDGLRTGECPPIEDLQGQVDLIFQCSSIIVECSFVAVGMDEAEAETQAIRRGHIAWSQLLPIVESNPHIEFILVHFSERYTDEELRVFFATASSSNESLPNVLLWLDEGLSRGASAP